MPDAAPEIIEEVPVMLPPTEIGLTVIVVADVFTVPHDPLVIAQ